MINNNGDPFPPANIRGLALFFLRRRKEPLVLPLLLEHSDLSVDH